MHHSSRALFVVLDGLVTARAGRFELVAGLIETLKDHRAMGYRIIGVAERTPLPGVRVGEFEFDALLQAPEAAQDWDFAPVAWDAVRRWSLDIRRSMLCGHHKRHERWARNAGLPRYETPETLFRLPLLP